MSERRFDPAGGLHGSVVPPADKSISHRAAIIAAMADGESRVEGYLDAADTRSTLGAIAAVGATVAEEQGQDGELTLRIGGVGLRGANEADIDVGNAGTLLRLIPGWLAGQGGGAWTLDGDESIRQRPVDRIAEPLRLMGATAECAHGFLPPLQIGAAQLTGIEYELPVASAQVKSCVLFAGLLADDDTTIVEPQASRDHSERLLEAVGADIRREGLRVTVRPADRLDPFDLRVPGDFSSAAFLLAAALLVPGSEVSLPGVGVNPTRTGMLSVIERMGGAVEVLPRGEVDGEPVAALTARHSALRATEVSNDEIPTLIDEIPLIALLGCFAEGETVVSGAAELRHKESDRLGAVVHGLGGLGAEIEDHRDGFVVHGSAGLQGGWLDSHGDHRLAMLGAIAGLASREGVTVDGMESAAVSYPRFEADLAALLQA